MAPAVWIDGTGRSTIMPTNSLAIHRPLMENTAMASTGRPFRTKKVMATNHKAMAMGALVTKLTTAVRESSPGMCTPWTQPAILMSAVVDA